MKSKTAQFRINAVKRINLGIFPLFIQLGHQGLTKSQPVASSENGDMKTFRIAKDILKVSISDPELYKNIESIELTYEKKA